MSNSTIQREAFHISGGIVESRWFVPEDMGIDAQMIGDIGDLWFPAQMTCLHQAKLPGGTLVRLYSRNQNRAREIEINTAFGEFFDTVLRKWDPQNPFGSYDGLLQEVRNPEAPWAHLL